MHMSNSINFYIYTIYTNIPICFTFILLCVCNRNRHTTIHSHTRSTPMKLFICALLMTSAIPLSLMLNTRLVKRD